MRAAAGRATAPLALLAAGAVLLSAGFAAAANGPFGDKPVGPQSLPGDRLPPFNMLDAQGRLKPMPQLKAPLHAGPGAPPESTAAGPPLATATKMAQTALNACSRDGYRVGVAVVDSAGDARAMLTADGADGSHVFVAMRKAITALAFGVPSAEANRRVARNPALLAKVTPAMFVMGGAVPIVRRGRIIGAIGVSGAAGAPPGAHDESCATAGLKAMGPRD